MADPSRELQKRIAELPTFPDSYTRDPKAMELALSTFIRSASGWRTVFAAADEDHSPEVDLVHREIAAIAARVFAGFLKARSEAKRAVIALATDTRPTGPALASVLARVFLAEDIEVRYLGVSAAPEVMAYSREEELDGFAYVSASHNPIGHNGLKFGLSDGGVVGGADAQALIKAFDEQIADAAECSEILRRSAALPSSELERLDRESRAWKTAALKAYLSFAIEVGTMTDVVEEQEALIAAIRREAERRHIGIACDFNGSARTLSIDRTLLKRLGVGFEGINDRPGEIVHTIVPEGKSLEPCARELEQLHKSSSGFLLGYVPDNDGDRGNIVFIDESTGRAETLKAQEVFALSCVAELSYLVYSGNLTYSEAGRAQTRHAVVVNGPTSLRIEAIAKAFDVQVFRSEVGEANVVNLARDSRNSGFHVRIMGEGSNGGNITHPASVRDPINTLFAFLKLLTLRSTPEKPGLYEIWCRRSGQEFRSEATLREMVDSLPRFTTTDVNDPRAIVDITSTDQARFKEAYEEEFLHDWDSRRGELNGALGIDTWEEINYEGMNEVHGFGRTYRSGRQRGGLKILFKDDLGRKLAFIWMRGSGTEPVFRVLADVKGDAPELERKLLDWHVSMIQRADAKVAGLVNASK